MTSYLDKIIGEIECHSVEGIRECFENGVSPNDLFNNKPLIYELTSEYGRGESFQKCVQVFLDYGLKFDDQPLLAVLLNSATELEKQVIARPQIVSQKYSLKCAYTPLEQATLLHICAEFNHTACAKILLNNGADVNVKAGQDKFGFGGQTPIFHTVNQNNNQSLEMLDFLLENGADLNAFVTGLIWGKTYPWETLIPSVNPISYAMMGLLPQMHRNERAISEIVQKLLKHSGIDYELMNVPNKYLN